MRRKIFILILLSTSFLFSKCLVNDERNKLIKSISNKKNLYTNVPNYIQCKKQDSKLNKFVCSESDYLLMFHYLSQINVYKYEDILKQELNHKTFNNKNMRYWHENFKRLNIKHLCFDLKELTTNLLGGESPYNLLTTNHKTYYIQKNIHGIILTNRNGYKIYLGKNCDTLDSNNRIGRWSKVLNKYLINLGSKNIYINSTELKIEDNKCLK